LDSALAFSHVPRFDIPAASGLTGNQMGLGWLVRDRRFLWHNRGTGGSGSFVGADPISHTGTAAPRGRLTSGLSSSRATS
jgi:hypothetical protein